MIKILVVGETYSSNLGDGVICETVKILIEKNIKNTVVFCADISGCNNYNCFFEYTLIEKIFLKLLYKFMYIFQLYKCEYIKSVVNFLFKERYVRKIFNESYDVIVFAGGQMFMDYFAIPIERFTHYAAIKNIPVIFNSCGTGHIKSKRLIYLLKKSLARENVIHISSRDDWEKINELYLKKTKRYAYETFDPALCINEIYDVKKKENAYAIGLGIMHIHDNYRSVKEQDLLVFWSNVIQFLNAKKIKWKLFCNGGDADYNFALKILKHLKYKNSDLLLERRATIPKELIESISTFKSIISFRLHSHIIATSLDIPSIAIVWDDKLKFFFRKIGAFDRCKTVHSTPKEILDALSKAENIGYDQNLLNKQRQFFKDDFLKNILNIIKK